MYLNYTFFASLSTNTFIIWLNYRYMTFLKKAETLRAARAEPLPYNWRNKKLFKITIPSLPQAKPLQ